MNATKPSNDRTLFRLGASVGLILVVLAGFDLLRGTGGRVWLNGVAAAEEATAPEASAAAPTLFQNVRVFDGVAVVDATQVLVQNGKIAAIGEQLEVPPSAVVIDGAGLTLMPGLIDSHTHAFGPVLEAALVMGVSTELDMSTNPEGAAVLRAEQERGEGLDRADLFSAGYLVTAPGGHGTEYGFEIPTLNTPEEADAFVQARIDEGSDYIKIVLDGGSLSRSFNTLDLPTIQAVIEAAHRRGKLAVVHVARQQDARDVIAAGADGIAHVFYDQPADPELVSFIKDAGAFVVPTLTVLESATGLPGGAELARDPRLVPYLAPSEITSLENGFPPGSGRERILDNGLATIRALHEAGVPILAGTDSPNPGTTHGASLHRELELLTQAGLTAAEALSAATSVPAKAFGLDDRGRIAVGQRADLLLVRGDPTADITATRDIVGVWKLGVRADREGYRAALLVAMQEGGEAPAGSSSGLVSDFDDGSLTAAFGSGWSISTDTLIGGSSNAEMAVVEGGGNGTAKALEISGTLNAGSIASWAGAMFTTGQAPFAPANMSDKGGFSFWSQGDGQPHAVMLFAQSLGQRPAIQSFTPGAEWSEFRFAFTDFPGADPKGLQALLFTGAVPGEFSFRIDEVRFW